MNLHTKQYLRRLAPYPVLLGLLLATRVTAAAGIETEAPAGEYRLDSAHASLIFRIDHLGFSHYTARFTDFTAQLYFDPEKPEASRLEATVEANSIETDFANPEVLDFNAQLRGEEWLDAAAHPEITFCSSSFEHLGGGRLRVTGELMFRGVTRPVVLNGTFNGGYAGHPLEPQARIGFSARTAIRRSEFGMTIGIPAPGTSMGVSDRVDIIIEAEFNGPRWKGTGAQPPVQSSH